MRRVGEFEDDDVLVTEDEEAQEAPEEDGNISGSEGAPPSSSDADDGAVDPTQQENDDDDDQAMADSDDAADAAPDPRFDGAEDDSDDDDDDDDDAAAAAARAPTRQYGGGGKGGAGPRSQAAVASALQKMDTEEQRAMLAGELTPEEALLRVEARELARRARRALRRHERAAGAAVAALAAALRSAMPADGALPAGARALAGAFMDALIGREAADMVARSAAAPPPAGVSRLGPSALGAAVAEEPDGAASAPAAAAAGGGAAAPVVIVDVALVLPPGVLAHKDHVGYRYHARRAVYLAAVAAHLSGGGGVKKDEAAAANGGGGGTKRRRRPPAAAGAGGEPGAAAAAFFRGWRQQWVAGGAAGGDPTLPRLVLWPPPGSSGSGSSGSGGSGGSGSGGSKAHAFVLRLTAVPAAASVFPPHRLHPDRNNVRWVARPAQAPDAEKQQQKDKQQKDKQQQQQQQPTEQQQHQEQERWLPTPQYNAALLAETHALEHAAFLRGAFFGLPPASSLSPSSATGRSLSSYPAVPVGGDRARAEAMADALALLQLWARRAGVSAAPAVGGARCAPPPAAALAAGGYAAPAPPRCPDGLSDHFLAMLLAHCCAGGGASSSSAAAAADADAAAGYEEGANGAAAAADAALSLPPPPHPLQAARAALRALADAAAWTGPKGVAMNRVPCPQADPAKRPPGPKALARRHEAAFAAPDGWCNLALGASAGALAQAGLAARRALALLERPAAGAASEALAAVFMDAPPAGAAFDYVWRVRMPPLRVAAAAGGAAAAAAAGGGPPASASASAAAVLGSDAGRAGLLPGAALHAHAAGDACGGLAREQERRAEGWARRALGDRAALLRALARAPPAVPRSGPCDDASRALGDEAEERGGSMFLVLPESADAVVAAAARGRATRQQQLQQAKEDDEDEEEENGGDGGDDSARPPVLLACVADPAQAARLVDVGPAADDPKQATRFRALWGGRSELRRLADGRICESVTWQGDVGADGRHAIADLAAAHVLRRHLPAGTEVVGSASALDPALRAPGSDEEEEEGEEEDGDEGGGGGGRVAAAVAARLQHQQHQPPPFEDSDAAAMRAAEGALERLARALRSLPQGAGEAGGSPGVPLRVVAALPASAAAGRRTLPFPPRPHPLATAAAAAASDRPLSDLPSAALGPAAAPFADAALGRAALCRDASDPSAASPPSSPSPPSAPLLLLLPRCLPDPIVVVAQLEGSGRWPEEPRAFAKMKLAVGAQLAAALARAHPGSCARAAAVELDLGPPSAQGAAAAAHIAAAVGGDGGGGDGAGGGGVSGAGTVELLWEGFAARIVLQTDRDVAAKQRALAVAQAVAAASAGVVGGGHNNHNSNPNNPAAAAAAASLALRPDLLRLRVPPDAAVATAHHGLVAVVAAAHPAFAPTCRLAARWVGCHLGAGAGGLRHEAVELLVAAVFGRAASAGGGLGGGLGAAGGASAAATAALCAPPASRVAGFLRFLRLLEQFPWSLRPLVVDPQGELEEGGAGAAGLVPGAVAPAATATTGGAAAAAAYAARQRRAAEAAFSARREAAATLLASTGGAADNLSNVCASAMFIATPRDMEVSYWTLDGPTDALLARLVAAAGRCAAALAAMVERGPGFGGGSGAGAEEEARRDARDDDSAWMRALFSPELGFGALLLLRPDALPSAGRALPCARRALARALASPGARRLPRLPPSQDRAGRAVLRGFPRALLRSQPAARLSAELLVGFDPVAALAARLSASLGAFAAFSADARGGIPVVGVRWRREAFAARALRGGGALAHCCVPLPPPGGEAGKKGGGGKKRRRGRAGDRDAGEQEVEEGEDDLVVVPDVAQVLREAQEIGAGIIDRALLFG